MIRVNEVSIITMAGIKLIAVISNKICNVTEYSVDPSAPVVTVTAGSTPSCANASGANNIATMETMVITNKLVHLFIIAVPWLV
jgi:hypothetical protein